MELEIEIESLHLLILLITAIGIILADHQGFAYLRGKKPALDPKTIKRLHIWVSLGLLGMILSGIILLIDEIDVLEEPAFYVKLIMVLALVLNGILIGQLNKLATTTSFASLSLKKKAILIASGGLSATCWFGAAIVGFFFL